MISFRYHLVSIVAVFLALALGVVVGTTALNGPVTKNLRNQVDSAKQQRDSLAGQVKALHGRVGDAGQFAATYGGELVAGTLTGKNVVLVSLPGVRSAMQNGVTRQLSAAGAKISGRVTLTKDYLDPSRSSGVDSLATGPAHPIGLTLPRTSDAGALGGALLAYVLLGHGQQTDVTQVLSGFAQLHMISLDGNDVTPASTVVVLGHGRMSANGYAGGAELALVSALAKSGGKIVVAGDGASADGSGLVALVRKTTADRTAVSTVDDADTAFGQVSTALALAATVGGKVGHYGTRAGADALFPAPAG